MKKYEITYIKTKNRKIPPFKKNSVLLRFASIFSLYFNNLRSFLLQIFSWSSNFSVHFRFTLINSLLHFAYFRLFSLQIFSWSSNCSVHFSLTLIFSLHFSYFRSFSFQIISWSSNFLVHFRFTLIFSLYFPYFTFVFASYFCCFASM
jgi:hypothetical protein